MVPMNGRIARLTLLIVSVLFILPTSSLSSMQKEDEQDTTNFYPFSLQLTQDDQKDTSTLFLSGTELNHLIDLIDQMINDIAMGENPHDVMMQFVTKRAAWKYPLLSCMITVLIRLRMIHNPVFIISQGWSYTLNPLRNTTLDLYRLLGIWHYGPGSMVKPSTTVILRHGYGTWEKEVLLGRQVGIVSNFYGLWLHIPKRPPQKSYTFVIGFAYHVIGFD